MMVLMVLAQISRRSVGVLILFSLISLIGACGGDTNSDTDISSNTNSGTDSRTGVRVVPVDDAAEVFENQPEGLVVLDVRTPDEFDAGHLDGAVMIDFYEADFEARIAELDRDAPYLLYCRSGNRSGTTAKIMDDLGFTDVTDIDGGIISWVDAGQPVVG